MRITENRLRQIIRSELLRENGYGPYTLGGATSREEAEEWSQANIQGRSFSDVGPIMANAISDFVTGTVDYVVNLAVANSTLRYNLGLWLAADESVRDEDREEYLSKATDAAIELAIANLMWYGGNYLFSSLQKLAGPAWQRWTGARLVGETPPNAASNELLKKFRAEVLTDDAIQAAQSAEQQTMRNAASVIDDATMRNPLAPLPQRISSIADDVYRDAVAAAQKGDYEFWQLYAGGHPEKIRLPSPGSQRYLQFKERYGIEIHHFHRQYAGQLGNIRPPVPIIDLSKILNASKDLGRRLNPADDEVILYRGIKEKSLTKSGMTGHSGSRVQDFAYDPKVAITYAGENGTVYAIKIPRSMAMERYYSGSHSLLHWMPGEGTYAMKAEVYRVPIEAIKAAYNKGNFIGTGPISL